MFQCLLHSLARDTAPPKKKAKKVAMIGGIVADWESRRKPTLPAAATRADFSNADDNSMVKTGGIVGDDEVDNVERKALAKEPTKIQKGGKVKIVIYSSCFINYSQSNYKTTSANPGNSHRCHSVIDHCRCHRDYIGIW